MFQVGDKVIISSPSTLPSEYQYWAQEWKDMIRGLNGKEVEVKKIEKYSGIDGIKIDKDSNYYMAVPWVPSAFLMKNSGATYTYTSGYDVIKKSDVIISNLPAKPSYMWCNACGGSGKHRLMCPVAKATVKFT